MGTLESVELGHAREVTRLGHPDICYHEITNPNINFVHFSLQPKNLKFTSFLPKQAFNWLKCNYSTIRVPTIMLCLILIYLFAKSQNIWAYLAWGFTKLYLTLRLETTFIRKKRLNIIKQSYILFFPKCPQMSFLAM